MRIVFFGTPDYVVPILDALHKAFRSRSGESPIVAVVTQAPKPVGREKKLSYSPVDSWAYQKKIPILDNCIDLINKQIDAEIGVLAAYGEIIPKSVINHFKFGILNVHPSLLPKLRGTSPIQAAILSGEKETGVTIIKLDEKLDHGPIISQFKEAVAPDDTTGSLRERLFARSAEVLITLVPAYLQGKINPRPQNDKEATFTTQVTKDHGFIPPKYLARALQGESLQKLGKWKIPFVKDLTLHWTPTTIHQFIRAMDPWPGVWTQIKVTSDKQQVIKRLKILKAHLEKQLVTSNLLLVPDIVQLEGKNPVSWKQFCQGYPNVTFE